MGVEEILERWREALHGRIDRMQPELRMGGVYNPWGVLHEVVCGECKEGVVGLSEEVRHKAGFLDILAYDGPLPPELKHHHFKTNYTLLSALFFCLEIPLKDIVGGVKDGMGVRTCGGRG